MENNRRLKTAIAIDDNPDVLSLFVELLQLKNFKVIGTGRNGRDAVELFQKLKPDITFLDVVMPGTDGIYALGQIRAVSPDSVVIMVTTDLSQDTAHKLEKLKATAVVYKPFDIDVLVKVVENIESDTNYSKIKFLN